MFEHATESQNAAAAENVKWFLDRRSRDPRFAQAPPPKMDPALAKQLAANTAADAAKSNAATTRRRKAQLFTAPYDKASESLASCEKRTPNDFPSNFSQGEWITIGKLALQRANDDLQCQGIPPITDKEAADISTFLAANDIYIGGDGAMLVGFSVLVAEGVIRPQAAVPAAVEPAAEVNPYVYSDYSGSDFARWERAQLVRDFDQAHTQVFRAGLAAASAALGGIEISEADVRVIREKCSSLPFYQWEPERIKNVALATLGGPHAVQTDPDEALSSVQILNKYGVGTSVQRNG